MLGELCSIGTADPLGTGASGGLPSAGQLPQPNGIGLSGSLGLSTNNVNQPEPTGQPMGQMPAGTGTSNTGMGSQMPAGMAAVEGFVTEDDLKVVLQNSQLEKPRSRLTRGLGPTLVPSTIIIIT